MASSAALHSIHPSASEAITPEIRRAVELELDAICGDTQFRASQRNCAFLRYVITETLAGRADEIKERTLGKELFGRPISYDTGSDAVVRVRANEVRKRLICYYDTNESQAGWRVHLPLRTYVPVFVPEATAKRAAASSVAVQPVVRALPEAPLIAQSAAEVVSAVEEPLVGVEFQLPVSRMVVPAFVALFLCLATFRWQVFSGTPYLDFWETLLSGHAGISLVLDADSADPHAVTTSDLQLVKPLLQTAALFHATTEISSSVAEGGEHDLLAVHITHHPAARNTDEAAYITLVPGNNAQLWVGSRNGQALELAVNSISSKDMFPSALEVAVKRNSPTRLRLADNEVITTETLPLEGKQ